MIVEFDFRTMCLGIAAPSTAVSVRPRLTAKRIKEVVARYYRIGEHHMESAVRTREYARPRQIAMYLCRELTGKSLPHIGHLFGDRDHTTVIHAVKQIAKLRIEDAELDGDIVTLVERLTGQSFMLSRAA